MHSLRGKRGLIGGLMFALAAAVALPVTAHAGPDPEAKRPNTGRYRLFAGNLGAITINRVYYGLNTRGEVGVDSLNSSTIGGGFWPKGTGNQYMFNSGLQVAGIIQGGAENPWAGDTTGGMFFDASGLRQHGTSVTELYNAVSPVDVANWPQAAYVPQGDASEELFDELLRGRLSASQGDVWFMSSEADPGLNAARPHPLGIVAEYRVLGWNYPSGNEDLLYLIVTFYNITSLNSADYAQYRPGLRELLLEQAEQFHSLNNATFTVDLPDAGYTIDPFYAAFSADPDVTNSASLNFASVNLPFAMGYTYHRDFPRASGWTFSPNIFGAPFFAGAGFVGIKYLKSATGPGEIELFSNTQNGGSNFPDPNSAVRLYKYLSGTVTAADGVQCNHGDPAQTHICFIGNTAASDVRMMQSSTPIALEAGQSASIVVSYIHAAPVQIPGYVGGTAVLPQDPRRLSDAALLAQGANKIDSLMGFDGYSDQNSDDVVQQNEFRAVRGSLLDKANTAQLIFDNKFLLPFAPDAPDFFLIPGDGQVTVVWRPSATETDGDPYYAVAKDAQVVPPGGGAPVANALYDANYRQFDVEGYRIYRGRSDTPSGLRLIAQYDYAGTTFVDYTGQIVSDARGSQCAPELGVTTSCAGVFNEPGPGIQLVKNVAYDLSGNVVQVQLGNRTLLASGDIINLTTDTAVTGQASGYPALSNTGVPFAYIDNEPRNGLTYFYAVTAFDVNSINSTGAGNTSLESARITKRVVPGTRAGNFVDDASVQSGVFGRNGLLTDNEAPTLDPTTGMWSKKALPTNATELQLAAFVRELLTEPGEVSIVLDSTIATAGGDDPKGVYHYTLVTPTGNSQLALPFTISGTTGINHASTSFTALEADPGQAASYDAPPGDYSIGGTFEVTIPSAYYVTNSVRACLNGQGDLTAPECNNTGPRWFSGDNETTPDPNSSNPGRYTTGLSRENFTNAGALPGVATIYEARSYDDYSNAYRQHTAMMSMWVSAADYHVYWGAGGAIDSVIDVTHDVEVPFSPKLGASWGILNGSAVTTAASYDLRAEITGTDIGCVEPFRTLLTGGIPCSAAAQLAATAIPGPVAYGPTPTGSAATLGNQALERTHPAAPGNGFLFYIKGHAFVMELEGGLPEAGTVWKLRDFVGITTRGNGRSGNFGDYGFDLPEGQVRPFSAAGAAITYAFQVTNNTVASTSETLAKVHTVPDPYYVTSPFEATTTTKIINFVNLPAVATIRIYTTSGVLVRVLKHETTSNGGETTWDVRNRNNQFVASGVYFYHVTAENGETTVGRMTIINYAQ